MPAPLHTSSLADRAEALTDAGRPREALALAQAVIGRAPSHPQGYAARVRARRALGDSEGALADLDALLVLDPACAPAHDARGVLLAEAGCLEAARSAFLTALACDASFARAHFGLASLGRVSAGQLAAMEALAGAPERLHRADRLFLLYALVRAYDEAGDSARAMACAEAGARLRAAPVRQFAAERPVARPQSPGGDPTKAPVFVFAMPRCGTTLVEQVLASLPEVHALGETETFARLAEAGRDPARLAAAYLAAWPREAQAARRVIDKSLGNFLHVGAIRSALPNAKLVHVRRDALDACLSIHFSLFAGDMPFPPDLAGIGSYWRGYEDLMARWRAALPADVLHEVRYERLVADPEGETRALAAFCGMEWTPRCLAFHETARPVATASLAQVRRPLYADSVGRARRYAPWLGPLREALQGSSR